MDGDKFDKSVNFYTLVEKPGEIKKEDNIGTFLAFDLGQQLSVTVA